METACPHCNSPLPETAMLTFQYPEFAPTIFSLYITLGKGWVREKQLLQLTMICWHKKCDEPHYLDLIIKIVDTHIFSSDLDLTVDHTGANKSSENELEVISCARHYKFIMGYNVSN